MRARRGGPPRQRAVGDGAHADQRAAVEPEHMLHVGGGARVERDRLLRRRPSQCVADAAQRRRDPRAFRRILARARRQRRRRPAGHAGLAEQLQHVGGPELEHLEARAGGVRRTAGPAGQRIDRDGAVQLADANRRLAGDVPRVHGVRAVSVRQVAALRADRDPADAGRSRQRCHRFVGARHVERVRDAEKERRRRVDADERRIALALEVADPDDEHVRTDEAGRPRVAEAPGRAGFPRDRPPRAHGDGAVRIGARIVPQHVERDERRFRAEQPDAFLDRARRVSAHPAEYTLVGEHRVQSRELFHRDFAAAERERQAVEGFRLQVAHAGALQELVQARLLQLRRDPHGRDVAAANQRLLGADRPEETAVEVFGRERTERCRRVAQHGLRVQHALVERQRVDERLEGRSRRPLRQHAVDLSVDRLVPVVRRPDPGLDRHVARVNQQRCRVVHADVAELFQVPLYLPLDEPLQLAVDRGVDASGAGDAAGQQRIDEVRRQERHRELLASDDRQLHLPAGGIVAAVYLQPLVAEPRASRQQTGLSRRPAGPARRPLRNHRERERFAQVDARRRLSEVDAGRGADALDVAAERDDVQVRFEQIAFRVARLQPERRRDLTKLAGRRPCVQPVRQPGQLHRQRRTALAPAAAIGPHRGARERDRIDPWIPVEPAILFQQERVDQRWRNLRQRHPQSVLIVGRARHPQQLAVGRPDAGGKRKAPLERRMRPCPQRDQQEHGQRGSLHDPADDPMADHGLTISSLPALLRPTTARLYMPSAKAGGVWKTPPLVARTRYTNVPVSFVTSPYNTSRSSRTSM